MPASTEQRDGKWRVVEPNGRLVRNIAGSPVDGGGFESQAAASRQARAINAQRGNTATRADSSDGPARFG